MQAKVTDFHRRIAYLINGYEFNKISKEDYQQLSQSGIDGVRAALLELDQLPCIINDRLRELIRVMDVLTYTRDLTRTSQKVEIRDEVRNKLTGEAKDKQTDLSNSL